MRICIEIHTLAAATGFTRITTLPVAALSWVAASIATTLSYRFTAASVVATTCRGVGVAASIPTTQVGSIAAHSTVFTTSLSGVTASIAT
jgi:hypothetical protein